MNWHIGPVAAALVATASPVLAAPASPALVLAQAPAPGPRPAAPRPPVPPAAPAVAAPSGTPASGMPASGTPAAPAPGGPAPAAPPPVPSRTEILNFENWVVTCNEYPDGVRPRTCTALLRILQQNSNQVVFSWTIALDGSKQPVAILQTPTGIAIPPGIELRIGKSPAHKIPFAACETGHCVATATMDAALLRELAAAPTAEAVIQGSLGATFQFTIQMKGFDKAFAALSR